MGKERASKQAVISRPMTLHDIGLETPDQIFEPIRGLSWPKSLGHGTRVDHVRWVERETGKHSRMADDREVKIADVVPNDHGVVHPRKYARKNGVHGRGIFDICPAETMDICRLHGN